MKRTKFFLSDYKESNTHYNPYKKFSILFFILLIVCICLSAILLIPQTNIPTFSGKSFFKKNTNNFSPQFTVVIDAGHGGKDPGKVGFSGSLEKNINLQIALNLKDILEAQDINVIMTREEDKELTTNDTNRKISDMKERVNLIEENHANLVISIHQNSYTSPEVYGAQCFYRTNSPEGKELASIIQNQIITSTNQTKIRDIKGNSDYYLLKYSPIPTVIAECGFLSNPEEEKLLLSEEYQRKIAWAIHLGVLQYLNQKGSRSK
ncbi:MAG: N-acetylmuramoyl-L-alanine amidase [Lachnospiraceae bacterium]|nr:N-acetylmuramoyl-L-alanine amidase [Lachnospiraceae bacterium]